VGNGAAGAQARTALAGLALGCQPTLWSASGRLQRKTDDCRDMLKLAHALDDEAEVMLHREKK